MAVRERVSPLRHLICSTPSGELTSRARTVSLITLAILAAWVPGASAQRIGVEAGHSGRTVGATGADCGDGLTEVLVTEDVSEKVADTLRGDGYTVDVLSAVLLDENGRQSDRGVWVHKGYSASVFISLHADVCNTTRSGYKVARWLGDNSDGTDGTGDASDRLVTSIWQQYGIVTGQKKDTAHITDPMRQYYALNPTRGITETTPGAILEMAYLSERDLTATDVGRWKMAYGIVNSITAFLDGELTDGTAPTITGFDVTPRTVSSGGSVTIDYTVSDAGGSGLSRAELWRSTDGGPGWSLIAQTTVTGNGPVGGSFRDTPPVGTHWYGVHAADNAGNWSVEPNPPGPILVTVLDVSGTVNVEGVWACDLISTTHPTQTLIGTGTFALEQYGRVIQGRWTGIAVSGAVPVSGQVSGSSQISLVAETNWGHSYFDGTYNATTRGLNGPLRGYQIPNRPTPDWFSCSRPLPPTLRIDGGTSSTRQVGETFSFTGWRYAPNRRVTRYVREPNGTRTTLTPALTTDSTGTLAWTFTPTCTTPTGTYTVWAVDDTTGRVSNTVTQTVTSNPACNSPTPPTSGFPESPHPYPDNYDNTWTYTFSGSASAINVTFDSQTWVEDRWDYIYVMDGNGNNITGSPFSGSSLAGQTKQVSGRTVRIRLTTDSSVTGYGFRVTNVTAATSTPQSCLTSVSVGSSTQGNWTSACLSTHRSGSYARFYSFTLSQADDIRIDLESSVDTYMYLLQGAGTNGSVVDSNDDGGEVLNSRITRRLSAGTYTIEATTYDSGISGSFTLRLARVPSSTTGCTIGSISVGGTVNGTWSAGCGSVHRTGSYAKYYRFTLSAQRRVQIDLSSSSFIDTYVYLLRGNDQNGTVIAEDDDSGPLLNSQVVATLAAGTYVIEATTYHTEESGSFTLSLATAVGQQLEIDEASSVKLRKEKRRLKAAVKQ